MATPSEVSKAIAEQPAPRTLQQVIELSAKELGRALPDHMRPERLVRIALTCIRTTPGMDACTQESFLGALFTAAELGIEPIAGRAYIIPFKNSRKKPDGSWHKVTEAEFVIGYKGIVELFYRHEKSIQLDWGIVKEKDFFEYEHGTDAFLRYRPATGDRGPTLGFWVMAVLANGGRMFKYMTYDDVMAHAREHSKSYVTKKYDKTKNRFVDCTPQFVDDSPWKNEPEMMCLKTVFIQLSKILPLSFEVQRAIAQDETSRDFRQGVSALDTPTTTDWKKEVPAGPSIEAPVLKTHTGIEDFPEPPELPVLAPEVDIPFGE
jgi:recombination protein RecT